MVSCYVARFFLLVIVFAQGDCYFNTKCPTGMEVVAQTGYNNMCFGVVDPTNGTLTYDQAEVGCAQFAEGTFMVYFENKIQMEIIREWFNAKGIVTSGEAGYWLAYRRRTRAPLEANGTLSEENEAIRKNRTLYLTFHDLPVPEDQMWRNEKQPGDKKDKRDEMCTAQSYPWDPAYAGMDDYPCSGYQLHYAVCMRQKLVQGQDY